MCIYFQAQSKLKFSWTVKLKKTQTKVISNSYIPAQPQLVSRIKLGCKTLLKNDYHITLHYQALPSIGNQVQPRLDLGQV